MQEAPVKAVRRRRPRWPKILLAAVGLIPLSAGGYYLCQQFCLTNFHTVVEGQVYRSAQPSPEQLERWVKEYGLRTVINLRAEGFKEHDAEKAAAKKAGVVHIDIRLTAGALPTRIWLRRLIQSIETARRPMLIHCKAGADRTGVASVLAAMAIGGKTYDQAKGELSIWYLHVDDDPRHIAGLLQEYEEYCRTGGTGTGGWQQFRQWALTVYYPSYYHVQIDSPTEAAARPGEVIPVELTVTNRSVRTIPAGDPAKSFVTAAFAGSSKEDSPDLEYGPRTPLPKRDIAPGESVKVVQRVTAPQAPGVHLVRFDLVEENETWFGRQGSDVATCALTVAAPSSASSSAPAPASTSATVAP